MNDFISIAGLVLGLLGTSGTIGYGVSRYRLRRARRFGAEQLGLMPDRDVQVMPAVIPYYGSREDRVDALAIGEVLAVRALTEYFAKYRPGGYQLRLNARDLDSDGLLILLGGPKWNQWTRDLLDALDGLIVVDEARRLVEVGTIGARAPGNSNRDLALVVAGRNPLTRNGHFLLCCGLQTIGTGAVARYLFEHLLPARAFISRQGATYRGFTAEVLLSESGYGTLLPATVEPFVIH